MEFLVQIEIVLPPDLDQERRSALYSAEADRAAELRRDGSIKRIWRVPGRRANVGLWEAADAGVLHEKLESLPLMDWMDIDVTPLAPHPAESGR